jgi:hypothetical protein
MSTPSGAGVVQRAGVKEELLRAKEKFSEFQEQTEYIDDLRQEVANSIYHTYKPSDDPNQSFEDKSDREKTGKSDRHQFALTSAQGLRKWSETATQAAQNIYNELPGGVAVAKEHDAPLSSIMMGLNTKTDPDASVLIPEEGLAIAVETKTVSSDEIAAVDARAKEGIEQLGKRKEIELDVPQNGEEYTGWKLNLILQGPKNSWPIVKSHVDRTKKAIRSDVSNGKRKIENAAVNRLERQASKVSKSPESISCDVKGPPLWSERTQREKYSVDFE